MRYLFVGIDPGTTVAYSIFDLDGNLIHIGSGRELSKEALVKKLVEFGKPVLFSCDVKTPHKLAFQLASYFNAIIFSPEKNLTEEEKKSLAKGFKFSNTHEMDALASCRKALMHHENKLRWAKRIAKERGIADSSEFAYFILSGCPASETIKIFEAQPPLETPSRIPQAAHQQTPRQLLISNAELRNAVALLNAEVKALASQVDELKSGVFERMARDKELAKKDFKIAELLMKLGVKADLKSTEEKDRPDIEGIVTEYKKLRGWRK